VEKEGKKERKENLYKKNHKDYDNFNNIAHINANCAM